MKRTKAFTLIELLVVVAIIALLIAILLPSLAKAKENTRRAVCGTRLRSIGSASAIYAAQFKDNVPQHSVGGTGCYWAWDVPGDTVDALLTGSDIKKNASEYSENSLRKLFYCPSLMESNSNAKWQVYTGGGGSGGVRGLGYAWFGFRPNCTYFNDNGNAMTKTEQLTITPSQRADAPITLRTRYSIVKNPARSELITDMVFTNYPVASSPNFALITGGSLGTPYTSPHIARNTTPEGMNSAFMDNHVEWRKFSVNKSHVVRTWNVASWLADD